eukprot:bmy_21731T0
MELLPHNLLSSHVWRAGPRGFSPHLQATKVHTNREELNPGFVAHMIPKLEWATLLDVADTLHLAEASKVPIHSVRCTTNYKCVGGNSATSRAWASVPYQRQYPQYDAK